MISHKKGEDINDAIKGPVGYLGLGILVLGLVLGIADIMTPNTEKPDSSILFGGFITDVISEVKYLMYELVPLIMIAGGAMVALQLKIIIIHPKKPNSK